VPSDQRQAATEARQGSGDGAQASARTAAEKLEALAAACQQCQGGAGECSRGLDGPLSLSPEAAQRTLEQLSQGRSIPGPPRPRSGGGSGQRAGSGGTGASGAEGEAAGGEGESLADWRPGQSFPGSQARLPILGPRTLVEQPRPQPGGHLGGRERGTFVPDNSAAPLGDAETLTPEARRGTATSGGALRGVPVPYRRDAEAYFRRLAEDEASR